MEKRVIASSEQARLAREKAIQLLKNTLVDLQNTVTRAVDTIERPDYGNPFEKDSVLATMLSLAALDLNEALIKVEFHYDGGVGISGDEAVKRAENLLQALDAYRKVAEDDGRQIDAKHAEAIRELLIHRNDPTVAVGDTVFWDEEGYTYQGDVMALHGDFAAMGHVSRLERYSSLGIREMKLQQIANLRKSQRAPSIVTCTLES